MQPTLLRHRARAEILRRVDEPSGDDTHELGEVLVALLTAALQRRRERVRVTRVEPLDPVVSERCREPIKHSRLRWRVVTQQRRVGVRLDGARSNGGVGQDHPLLDERMRRRVRRRVDPHRRWSARLRVLAVDHFRQLKLHLRRCEVECALAPSRALELDRKALRAEARGRVTLSVGHDAGCGFVGYNAATAQLRRGGAALPGVAAATLRAVCRTLRRQSSPAPRSSSARRQS